MPSILIIEDELVLAHQLAVALGSIGHEVAVAETAKEGVEAAAAHAPDLILLDLRLPDASGLDVISSLRTLDPAVQVVLMTAFGSQRDALEAMRRGVSGYLTKPLDVGELSLLIERLQHERNAKRELAHMREQAGGSEWQVLAASEDLAPIFEQVERLCDPAASPGQRPPLVLRGEPGSGRRAVARALHERLDGGPFLEIEAGGDAVRLEESLFGIEPGPESGGASLTSLFEAGEGGTLVIHDAQALPAALRARLVEATTSRRIRRRHGRRDRPVQVQLILTLGRGPEGRAPDGLSEALRALEFDIPPLRERPRDVVALARHFAAEMGTHVRGTPSQLDAGAAALLAEAEWAGNLTELRNIVERAVIDHTEETLDARSFTAELEHPAPWVAAGRVQLPHEGLVLEDVERDLLRQALERTGGNQTRAARLLGLTRDTLRYRVGKLGLGGAPGES